MLTRFTPAWAAPHRRAMCALSLVGALLAATPAQALELAGAQFPDQITVANKPLQLNGAGVRYKAMFRVYAAGLYAPSKSTVVAEVSDTATPKRLHIVMLREIDSTELGNMFARGMEENAERGAMTRLLPSIMRMSQVFSDHKRLVAGDSFQMDWVPGTGAVLTIKGKVIGEPFREPEFYRALLGIWLGPKPADWKLKDAMLGREN